MGTTAQPQTLETNLDDTTSLPGCVKGSDLRRMPHRTKSITELASLVVGKSGLRSARGGGHLWQYQQLAHEPARRIAYKFLAVVVSPFAVWH